MDDRHLCPTCGRAVPAEDWRNGWPGSHVYVEQVKRADRTLVPVERWCRGFDG
jgi:hypothetical protein